MPENYLYEIQFGAAYDKDRLASSLISKRIILSGSTSVKYQQPDGALVGGKFDVLSFEDITVKTVWIAS